MAKRKNTNVDNFAYHYRLYPNKFQKVLINKTFGCVRFVYNHLLADHSDHYEKTGQKLKKEVSEYKSEHEFLKEVDSLALANAKMNLETSFKNFFEKRTKYPKFHKKGQNDSYTTNRLVGKSGSANIEIVKGGIKLPKLGVVKIKQHRLFGQNEVIKNCTISRTAGKYYISIITERPKVDVVQIDDIFEDKCIGIDFSVPHFYVDSEGNVADYPKAYRKMEKKLAREQKNLSRKEYKSANYYKQLRKVQKIHNKIANQRKDYAHKKSRELVDNYDLICFEDIDLSTMKRTLRFGKSISDAGFGMFRDFVTYKAEREGKHVIKIDKWYASTKTCSKCGYKNNDIILKTREWTCQNCGERHNRDHNAAINIKNEGLRIYQAA